MAESNNGMQLSCVPQGWKIKRKFTSFFSIPLASVLLTSVFGLTGFCGENDDDDVSTPAKRKARTQAAREEICLFPEKGDENDPSPHLVDPPVFRQRKRQAQSSAQKLVRQNNTI